jgi:hypothetical protein
MTPETIELDVPAEPAQGSVALDHYGIAWQARKPSIYFQVTPEREVEWIPAIHHDTEAGSLSWRRLLAERGPLTLVHRAEEPTDG